MVRFPEAQTVAEVSLLRAASPEGGTTVRSFQMVRGETGTGACTCQSASGCVSAAGGLCAQACGGHAEAAV